MSEPTSSGGQQPPPGGGQPPYGSGQPPYGPPQTGPYGPPSGQPPYGQPPAYGPYGQQPPSSQPSPIPPPGGPAAYPPGGLGPYPPGGQPPYGQGSANPYEPAGPGSYPQGGAPGYGQPNVPPGYDVAGGAAGYGAPAGDSSYGPPAGYGPTVQTAYVGGPGPGEQPKRSRLPLILIIGAVVAVLVIGGIVGAILLIPDKPTAGSNPTAVAPTTAETATQPPSATASDAVRGYFEALAKGDATTALSYSAVPKTGPLLTAQALAASSKAAPISAITVDNVADQSATSVPVSYKVGSTSVRTSVRVLNAGSGWKLLFVTGPLVVQRPHSSMDVIVDGVKVSGVAEVFPGQHTIATSHPYLGFKTTTALVKTPGASATTVRERTTITSKGKAAALAAAKKDLKRCLNTRKLAPSGCPYRATAGAYKVTESTVRWRLTGSDPWKKAKYSASGTVATYKIKFKVHGSARCSLAGRRTNCVVDITGTTFARTDLAGRQLKVVWTRT